MRRIAHMVDEVCKEVETRRLPPGAKIREKREDSLDPSTYSRIMIFFGFSSRIFSKSFDRNTTPYGETSSFLK